MKTRIKWDEANLREIEKEKPVRKKIAEPKTPYHPMIEEDGYVSPVRDFVGYRDSAAHAAAIRNALDKIISSQKHFTHFRDAASGGDEITNDLEHDEDNAEERQNISFEEKRKAHYDEFLKMKELEWRNGSFLDDDNDENDESIHKKRCISSSLSSGMREVLIIDGDEEILRTISIQGSSNVTSPPSPSEFFRAYRLVDITTLFGLIV